MSTHLDPHHDGALWSQYLEGDLNTAERNTLEVHLRECEICRNEVKKMRQTVQWLSQLAQSQEVQAPQDFEQKVRRHLRQKRHKQRFEPQGSILGSPHVTTGLLFAVLILITLVLLYVFQYAL